MRDREHIELILLCVVYLLDVVSVEVTRIVPIKVMAPPNIIAVVILSFSVRDEISTPRNGSR
jgi:hypothetical protein